VFCSASFFRAFRLPAYHFLLGRFCRGSVRDFSRVSLFLLWVGRLVCSVFGGRRNFIVLANFVRRALWFFTFDRLARLVFAAGSFFSPLCFQGFSLFVLRREPRSRIKRNSRFVQVSFPLFFPPPVSPARRTPPWLLGNSFGSCFLSTRSRVFPHPFGPCPSALVSTPPPRKNFLLFLGRAVGDESVPPPLSRQQFSQEDSFTLEWNFIRICLLFGMVMFSIFVGLQCRP